MSEQKSEYVVTTDSAEYESWEWYREYLQSVELARSGTLPHAKKDFQNKPLKVELGVKYSRWILETPELLDIIFRRFIFGNYENELEGNLLHFSAIFFMRRNEISGNEGFLGICWGALEKLLKQEITSLDSPQFRADLLKNKFAFCE